ncbi:MAG: hypothetical protein KAG18_05930, partial [Sinobacterium sp.]|nr:hypothetical protein [Sinobacterium sp.]
IIDLKNRSWYVPMKTAERAVIKSTTAEQHNPLCTVSVDYEGDAIKHWRLNKKSTTIIVDGKGKVIFVDEGVLGSEGQKKVISLLKHNGKPYTEWPGRKPPSQH